MKTAAWSGTEYLAISSFVNNFHELLDALDTYLLNLQ